MASQALWAVETRQERVLAGAALREALDAEGRIQGECSAQGARDPKPVERRDGSQALFQTRKLGREEGVPGRVRLPDPYSVEEDEEDPESGGFTRPGADSV